MRMVKKEQQGTNGCLKDQVCFDTTCRSPLKLAVCKLFSTASFKNAEEVNIIECMFRLKMERVQARFSTFIGEIKFSSIKIGFVCTTLLLLLLFYH